MIKQNNKSTLKNSTYNPRLTDKKSLVIGGIIVLLIALSPILFYSYESFPTTKVWKTFFFEIETSYGSWYQYSWFLAGKAIPVYLLLIWFFTCKHWWHWIILVPLAMYSFQLWSLCLENSNQDSLEIVYILPLMAVIIPFVYLIRAKLFNSVRGDNLQSFEEELGQKRTLWGQIKDLFS
jgi:hypothetical protein